MGDELGLGRRRALARAFSRIANASVDEVLAAAGMEPESRAWRIGVTGPPGAGKSTLIARLARTRLDRLGEPMPTQATGSERLAVFAVDPSSPIRGGAILGDRVRMEALACDTRVYVRSLASRSGRDGIAHNMVDLLTLADSYGFADVILETVGVGQAEHAVRVLVDSLVLVLHPDAGDSIQAMKSGIVEVADVYVVNKADLPSATRTSAELRAILRTVRPYSEGWTPPVIEIGRDREEGVRELDRALESHRAHVRQKTDEAIDRKRECYRLRSLLQRRMDEILEAHGGLWDMSSAEARYDAFLSILCEGARRRDGQTW